MRTLHQVGVTLAIVVLAVGGWFWLATPHGSGADQGEGVDAAVIQTDHASYADLSAEDLPGVKVLVDGRRVTDPAKWEGTRRIVIGG